MSGLASLAMPPLLVTTLWLGNFPPKSLDIRFLLSSLSIALCTTILIGSYYDLPVPAFIPSAFAEALDFLLLPLIGAVILAFAVHRFVRDYRAESRRRAERAQS